MCGPPALAAVAAVMATVGTGVSAMQSAAQSRYQAKVADRNAKLEAEAAHRASEATKQAVTDKYRQIARESSQRRAIMAANGVDLDFGSARQVQEDAAMLGREEVGRIYERGAEQTRGFDIQASNWSGQAGASRQAATGALVSGGFNMASTALGGAMQYADLRADRPRIRGNELRGG